MAPLNIFKNKIIILGKDKTFNVFTAQTINIPAIKYGILPIIFSIPNKNISYVEEIDKLYSKNIRV